MSMLIDMLVLRMAGKCQEPHPEHVKSRDAGRRQGKEEQQQMLGMGPGESQSIGQYGILAIPATEKRNAADRQNAGQHGQGGDLHLGIKSAHSRHFLLMMATVNDAAGA